jgi:hypothetical protein
VITGNFMHQLLENDLKQFYVYSGFDLADEAHVA